MLARQKFEWKRSAAFEMTTKDYSTFCRKWNEIDLEADTAMLKLMRWWPVIFWPTVATGFGGASVLAWNAFMAAFRIPLELVG